ncbi:AMP-binding protein [Tomitella fengzijianii]|nr:AMP-binding protein [Tomitella fengzijianii]
MHPTPGEAAMPDTPAPTTPAPAATATPTFAPVAVAADLRPDGVRLLHSTTPLAPHEPSLVHAFRAGAAAHPGRTLLAQRTTPGEDAWRTITWGDAAVRVERLAAGLLERGLADRPVMILSPGGIEHLVLMLAAMSVGAPVVPSSVAYALTTADHAKLRAMADLVDPAVVFADGPEYAHGVAAVSAGRTALSADGAVDGTRALAALESADPSSLAAVRRRADSIDPGTVAKILFTSGSTGAPKGVINTHGMLTANQQQMRQAWPFLAAEPPVLLDWLPWSHTFGGNHNLNMVLMNGGTMWIDDGRPAPGMIERTVRNMTDVAPTVYFNVPAGYGVLLPILEADESAAAAFFASLRLGFYAAAALPQELLTRIRALARRHGSGMEMTTSWGQTETAPAMTTAHFRIDRSDTIGVPLPGCELKLVPSGPKQELRVRGPNVTPGFFRRPDLTAAAFDDEGYLRTGDAVRMVDEDDPARGLAFDGRIAEDFKLATGTFVSVGTLRPELLSAADGLLTDAVICGHDREEVTALAWPAAGHAGECDENGVPTPRLRDALAAALARLADGGRGSSQRIERLRLLTEWPSLDAGEITDKGYLNQRVVRERRAADVALVTAGSDDARIIHRPNSANT